MQKPFGGNRNFRNVSKQLALPRVGFYLKKKKWMKAELIFFFPSSYPYSPFVCLSLNDYKQTYCTTDSLLIVPSPMKCGAIWHMDKGGRLMANKEHHSFSPSRFGQKANVFNQIYMFLRNIGCWKFASSWISPLPSSVRIISCQADSWTGQYGGFSSCASFSFILLREQ